MIAIIEYIWCADELRVFQVADARYHLQLRGGSFYSGNMLPELRQKVTLLNPVLYLINGFRWRFFKVSDVSVIMICGFLFACMVVVYLMFRTGYEFRQ